MCLVLSCGGCTQPAAVRSQRARATTSTQVAGIGPSPVPLPPGAKSPNVLPAPAPAPLGSIRGIPPSVIGSAAPTPSGPSPALAGPGGNVIASNGGNQQPGDGAGIIAGNDGSGIISNHGGSVTPGAVMPGPTLMSSPLPAALAGTVLVPSGLISNNGGTLISDGGTGLIPTNGVGVVSDNGSSLQSRFRLTSVGTAPAPGIQVQVVDAAGAPVPGIAPVTTDASGRYRIPTLPAGTAAVYLQARLTNGTTPYTFGALARLAGPPRSTDITPASTLVQRKAIAVLNEQDGKPDALDPVNLTELESATEAALDNASLPDFSAAASTLVSGFDKLLQGHPQLASAAWTLDHNVGCPMVRAKTQLTQGVIFSPEHLAYNAQGDLLIAGLNDNTIWKLPAGSSTLVPFAKAPDLKWPHGIAVDAKGNVYTGRRIDVYHDDPANNTKQDTPGKQVFKIDPTGQSVTALPYTFASPWGMCMDHDGHTLYVCNADANNGELLAYDTLTDTVRQVASGLNYCNGVAQDSNGTLYVTHLRYDTSDPDATKNGWRGAITRIDTSGKVALFYPGYMDVTGSDRLEGIAVDAADNLYVTNNWGNTIYKFTPRQKKIQTFLTFDQPTGVAFDPHGNLAVANYITGDLTLLTP